MALESGTRFGSYEVVEQIGSGGMGEVWRARDTKLERDVAIKTLPSGFAGDADRLARFAREAKLLASLNHNNIASIYSLDEHEGTHYLAMELVEGETLEERLKAGALPVDDALRIGLQIALALEAAHEQGIVHRDLKPANVMLTAGDQVKVLDFGLAKAFSGNPLEASPAHSPALSIAMTQQGIILGTAGYMSPEQASGQATDQRADVWSFGVVLYEMLTGLPLFSGESVPHILADVLRADPDWERLPKHLHPRLRASLERCLEKKPRSRYHSIADVRVDIEAVLTDPDGVDARPGTGGAGPAKSLVPRLAVAVLATTVIVAGIAVLIDRVFAPEPESREVSRFTIDIPAGQVLRGGFITTLALSPDGRRLVYNTEDGLYLREMDELSAEVIPGSEIDMLAPMFTPDSDRIMFLGQGRGLFRISITGGVATSVIADTPDVALNANWLPDGDLLVGHAGGVSRFSMTGGTDPELILDLGDDFWVGHAQLLPDGETLLFSIRTGRTDFINSRIVVTSLAGGGELEEVVARGHQPRYLPETGHLLYTLDNVLYAVVFDPDTRSTQGEAEPVLSGVRQTPVTADLEYQVAGNGTLVYMPGASGLLLDGNPLELYWLAADGSTERLMLSDTNEPRHTRLSPDGSRLAVSDEDGDGNSDIYVHDLERQGSPRRITRHEAVDGNPVWSPDGEFIYFASQRDGGGLYRRAANATGEATKIADRPEGAAALVPNWVHPDGTEIVVGVVGPPSNGIYRLSLSEGAEFEPLIDDPDFNEILSTLSADRNWIVYNTTETGQNELYISPYPDVDSGKEKVSTNGGREPIWDPTSNAVYYLDSEELLLRVTIDTDPNLVIGTPEPVSEVRQVITNRGPFSAPNYDFDPRTQRLLVASAEVVLGGGGEQTSIVVVQNWFEELERLVPTD